MYLKNPATTNEIPLDQKLNLETARINWHELQIHFFARGICIYVAPRLDLINIAYNIATNKSAAIALIQEGKIGKVSGIMAQQYYDCNQPMWAVVVMPYVLVQPDNTIVENN